MPKQKTHRGAAKRFTLTKSGKVKFRRANRNHILTKKSPDRKRRLRKDGYMAPGDARHARQLLSH